MSDRLIEYIISYSKDGFETPVTTEGLNEFRNAIEKARVDAVVGTDYNERVQTVSALCVLSFASRPDTKTLSSHRIWSDAAAAKEFFDKNNTTIFENFRKAGWTVSYTHRTFDTSALNASDIDII